LLNLRIWELLGRDSYPDPQAGDDIIFQILALEHEAKDDTRRFWARIKAGVIAGEIQVAEGVQHTMGDGARLLEGLGGKNA
jgi:hypothetical protein